MDILQINGEKIREMRDSLGWSRELLSEKSGIPSRTIQDIETGQTSNPGIETLKPLLKAMGIKGSSQNGSKSDIIVEIISRLTAMDDDQLRSVLGFAEDLSTLVARNQKKSSAI